MAYTNESVKLLVGLAMEMFSKKKVLNSLHQEIAENFYPERADFTYRRSLGDEFADHLYDSYPVMVRRDLGNAFGAMLRPADKTWHNMRTTGYDSLDHAGKQWLEVMNDRQHFYMTERLSCFANATKEGDHDFAAFGQCVIHVDMRRAMDGILFRTHHLRDIAWLENSECVIDNVFRKFKPYVTDLITTFGEDNVHNKVKNAMKKSPYAEVNCMHIIAPVERYEGKGFRAGKMKHVSLYVDVDNEEVMEVKAVRRKGYVIPRWQRMSDSQYAYSPAALTALPDARMIQAMTLVLLEAGEKFVNPPMIATTEVVRNDVALYPGGITWVDRDYDEKLGAALRPLTTDKSGMPIGFELTDRTRRQIHEAFYLNKISMQPIEKDATAFEVGQVVQEYIRQAMPLFAPIEMDYNGPLCEEAFDMLLWNGAFGSHDDIPESLSGEKVEFKFESPLHESEGKRKGQLLMEASQLLGTAAEMDPTVVFHVDIHKSVRGALDGIGVPKEWMKDEKLAGQEIAEAKQKSAQQEELAMAGAAAEVAKTGGEAAKGIVNEEGQRQ